jgi:hypothetical protein
MERNTSRKCILWLTLRRTQIISCRGNRGIAIAGNSNGVDFLPMSASQELEPGPSRIEANLCQRLAKRLAVQVMTREALGFERAVGWGGSAPG